MKIVVNFGIKCIEDKQEGRPLKIAPQWVNQPVMHKRFPSKCTLCFLLEPTQHHPRCFTLTGREGDYTWQMMQNDSNDG